MNNSLNRFDWIASFYDTLAGFVFGKSIKRAQKKYLNVPLAENSRVLVLGGGTGWWLTAFISQNPTVEIWYLEASSKMIELAKKKVKNPKKIYFIHGTEKAIPTGVYFDLVITFFLLDVFSNQSLDLFINKIKGTMNEKGIWLVADFVRHKFWHSWLLKIMYLFFWITGSLSVLELPKWEVRMKECGFYPSAQASFFGGFIYSYIYKRGREFAA